jgi:hypothetical protein
MLKVLWSNKKWHSLQELELYRDDLLDKPAMLVVNKMDVAEAQFKYDEVKDKLKHLLGECFTFMILRYVWRLQFYTMLRNALINFILIEKSTYVCFVAQKANSCSHLPIAFLICEVQTSYPYKKSFFPLRYKGWNDFHMMLPYCHSLHSLPAVLYQFSSVHHSSSGSHCHLSSYYIQPI